MSIFKFFDFEGSLQKNILFKKVVSCKRKMRNPLKENAEKNLQDCYTSFMKDNLEYQTIFFDDDIVLVNKKSGFLTASDRHDSESPRLDLALEKEFGKLFAVHRIDKDASGIVLYAKNENAQAELSKQFDSGAVKKVYHCLVNGHPYWDNLHVDLKLLADGDYRHRTVTNKKFGKVAITDFKNLGSCGPYSWIEALPQTDRTNQIRAHLLASDLTIVCDPLYSGNQKPVRLSDIKRKYNGDTEVERPLLSRLALHAYSLEFKHPVNGQLLTFTAPYPKDMEAVRKQLAKIFKVDPLGTEC